MENEIEEEIKHSEAPPTQKQQLIQARRGQGTFRQKVARIESQCRVTGLNDKRLLIASHIKPWKYSTNEERLDGHNGLLLSPHIDRLFDKGWISFTNEGILLISTKQILPVLQIWHIDPQHAAGLFSSKQKIYLDHHRKKIFKG